MVARSISFSFPENWVVTSSREPLVTQQIRESLQSENFLSLDTEIRSAVELEVLSSMSILPSLDPFMIASYWSVDSVLEMDLRLSHDPGKAVELTTSAFMVAQKIALPRPLSVDDVFPFGSLVLSFLRRSSEQSVIRDVPIGEFSRVGFGETEGVRSSLCRTLEIQGAESLPIALIDDYLLAIPGSPSEALFVRFLSPSVWFAESWLIVFESIVGSITFSIN